MAGGEAVEAGKARRDADGSGEVTVLSTGIRARLTPVSAALIQDCISRVKEPKVPMWHNEETEMDEPNYVHPEYLEARAEFENQQAAAALDAVILFGMELEDGVPEDDRWLKKLVYLSEKRGALDLSPFDLDDEMDLEFVYKRYIAIGVEDYALMANLSGVSMEEVARATRTFPGDKGGGSTSR